MMFLFWAILLLGVLVLAHELGHFLVAKALGVKVPVFSIGFGPKLIGLKVGETEYRLSLFPLGGYVKLVGQEASEDLPAAFLTVNPGSSADKAGIKPGDILLSLEGKPIRNWIAVDETLVDLHEPSIRLGLERAGKKFSIQLPPTYAFEVLGKGDAYGHGGALGLTEWGVSIGDDPVMETQVFHKKPIWVRTLVVAAGPVASLVFPLFIYLAYYASIDELTSSRIGQVFVDTPAAKAGIRPGDRILSIGGENTRYWPDMAERIQSFGGMPVAITYERHGMTQTVTLTPESSTYTNELGDAISQGRIGIASSTIPALVGPNGENSPAGKAGIKLGDRVVSLNGEKIEYIWQLEEQLEEIAVSGRAVLLGIERNAVTPGVEPEKLELKLIPEQNEQGGFETGLFSADTFAGKVEDGTPAFEAGLRAGDRIVAVENRRVSSWLVVEQALRERQEQPVHLIVDRGGQIFPLEIKQAKESVKTELGDEMTRYRFGAWSAVSPLQWMEGERIPVENRVAFSVQAASKTLVAITILELRVIGKLIQGDLPFKMVGGPIMIFDIAGRSAEMGWQSYIQTMALISINLGILNLLPIPVLDGGHLLFFALEFLMRRPVPAKVKEKAIMTGFFMLMLLMVFVFKNDLERYWDRIFG